MTHSLDFLGSMTETDYMTRCERLRRVFILCTNFTRNLGYIRGADKNKDVWAPPLVHPLSDFCVTAYNNFLDTCVLEWCKLFGDKKGEHYWGAIVTDPVKFERELLQHLSLDAASFETYRLEMRTYRDKFVAHLNSELRADIPSFDLAWRAVEFYYDFLVIHEAAPGDLAYLPVNVTILRLAYEQQFQPEAMAALAKLAGAP